MRKVVLTQAVRLFKRTGPDSSLLAQTGTHAEAGVEIAIEPAETMAYDHMNKSVVSFKCKECPETHYILVEETGLALQLTN